jgi:glucose-6-phosphate isomerase
MVDRASQFTISPAGLESVLDKTFIRLSQLHFPAALEAKDPLVWDGDDELHNTIANRLGWVEAIDFVREQAPRMRAAAEAARRDGFTDVVLLGMGGSSLAPEVMRQTLGVAPGFPRFRMLDSVDPDAVRDAMSAATSSLFVFASKSGGTIEPNAMAAEARQRLQIEGVNDWGSRFLAITDEGTALHALAQEQRFRDVFVNPSTIGGRYSALSLFGMVPAALMGIDIDGLLERAADMEERCFMPDVHANPGMALGALMAAAASLGRDKLTLVVPPALASFGLWVEQLVAESTGKQGKGIVPITGEAADAPIGDDRLAVFVHLPGERPAGALREQLRASGTPMMDIEMPDVLSLGAEFFRWEVATAAAGRLLDINPFDEPNVQQAKEATRKLLHAYVEQERLPVPDPQLSIDGIGFTVSRAARERLGTLPPTHFLTLASPRDYVGLLAYLPPSDAEAEEILRGLRARIGAHTRCATMAGYGPRYLHSTGQLHKGGANNGVFVIVTAPPGEDLQIPGEPYSFGTLELAQAVGDFQSLDHAGRRAILVQLPWRDSALLTRAFDRLLGE